MTYILKVLFILLLVFSVPSIVYLPSVESTGGTSSQISSSSTEKAVNSQAEAQAETHLSIGIIIEKPTISDFKVALLENHMVAQLGPVLVAGQVAADFPCTVNFENQNGTLQVASKTNDEGVCIIDTSSENLVDSTGNNISKQRVNKFFSTKKLTDITGYAGQGEVIANSDTKSVEVDYSSNDLSHINIRVNNFLESNNIPLWLPQVIGLAIGFLIAIIGYLWASKG